MVGECIEAYKNFLKNYTNFKDSTSRKEFWLVFLDNCIIGFILGFISGLIPILSFLTIIYGLAVIIPEIAIAIRRMHDMGKSGWLVLLYIIPVVGWIILLVLCAMPGKSK